jgi:hypothetical protein
MVVRTRAWPEGHGKVSSPIKAASGGERNLGLALEVQSAPLILSAVLAVALTACSGGEEEQEQCETVGELRCADAEVLEECGDLGWKVSEDCAADGMICHEERGHCMEMADSGMGM